jgi:hypothetical protein
MEIPDEVYREVLEIFQSGDINKAKEYIDTRFGEDADLNIVKCDKCGKILSLTPNLLASCLTGGDKRVSLAIWRHLEKHPDHYEEVAGYSHSVRVPIGHTLWAGLKHACRKHGVTAEEGIRKRIEYLETKLGE